MSFEEGLRKATFSVVLMSEFWCQKHEALPRVEMPKSFKQEVPL